ncbi:hypothetical protein Desgi_2640 [Desulfoscipio gibsoniae DSM 7213]|uniref:Prepilin-type N-terminal cleavage/methylation domain-containing protein n=1 Tax=Desulfoscipio gibsoniae DSM 7213 TaxID=767817 RepID=R4KR09_9FIRM|nr:hypothetical protein Desgi_2640 [Desulfoscipio gibsoniae DSM 7213]
MLTEQRGFIILEVLSSVLILSICAVVILFAVTTSTKQLAVSMQRLKAMEIAHGKLEETMGVEFDAITSIPKTNYPASYGEYHYAVDIENDVECSEFLKKICVTVYFTEPLSGLEKSVTIAAARAKR